MVELQGIKGIPTEPQLRKPSTYTDYLEGLKSRLFGDRSVMDPSFTGSLRKPEGSPVEHKNIQGLLGDRTRQLIVDPARRFGESVDQLYNDPQNYTIKQQLDNITGLIDLTTLGVFSVGKKGLNPNILRIGSGPAAKDIVAAEKMLLRGYTHAEVKSALSLGKGQNGMWSKISTPTEAVVPAEKVALKLPAPETPKGAVYKSSMGESVVNKIYPKQGQTLTGMATGTAAGVGVEEDENGNEILTFDPTKAVIGAVLGAYGMHYVSKIGVGTRVKEGIGAGKFLRGGAEKTSDTASVVAKGLNNKIVNRTYDGVDTVDEAIGFAKDGMRWLDPVIVNKRQTLRYKPDKVTGLMGNSKLAQANSSFESGRSTWDIQGCGRNQYAELNELPEPAACYGGACYADKLMKAKQGIDAGVDTGVRKTPVRAGEERNSIIDYWKENGLDKTQDKFPEYEVKVNTHKGSKNFGSLSIGKLSERQEAAMVPSKFQKADGKDIRIGVDTDGSAYISKKETLDSMLEANPRTLTIYSSAYHTPPPKHKLAERSIVNVTVSGWHPLPETMHRLEWARQAKDNGWNVILREVTADPNTFDATTVNRYNRLHDALLDTDFFVMEQPLHQGASHGKITKGLPGCCVGSKKNPRTCDSCETAEGTGKGFQNYWGIGEEPGDIIMPDSPYTGLQAGDIGSGASARATDQSRGMIPTEDIDPFPIAPKR